ncbi:MAG: RNA pseudouridine synthase [Puniceicoccales bacterium]|nr:RNA pseudouridine synthase [Puniceicoccales bacterium]
MEEDSLSLAGKLPLGTGVRVVATHPSGLIALDKPEGILAHPNKISESEKSLIQASYNLDGEFYSIRNQGMVDAKAYLLNRIDSPTSGLILVATNLDIAGQIKKLFRENAVTKIYYAIVKGSHIHPALGVWRDTLSKTHAGSIVRSTVGNRGYPAVTHYAWIRSDVKKIGLSLLRLEPKTGRTHQLRVQCVVHGFPILGDKTYGDFSFNRRLEKVESCKRMFLHSASVSFSFTWNGKLNSFYAETKLPDEFEAVLGESASAPNNCDVQISPQLKIRVNTSRRKR